MPWRPSKLKTFSWKRFVAKHGWLRVELLDQETYPGADPLFWSAIVGILGTEYQIAAEGPYGGMYQSQLKSAYLSRQHLSE